MKVAGKELTGADFLLLLLYLGNKSPIYGSTRLIKMMFLFEKEIKNLIEGVECSDGQLFLPYLYGPFSKDVYEQIDLFCSIGFISVQEINVKHGDPMTELDDWEEEPFSDEIGSDDDEWALRYDGKCNKYSIRVLGASYVESEIFPLLSPNDLAILDKFKNKITQQTSTQILKYVYTNYPEYTGNSVIKDEVLRNG